MRNKESIHSGPTTLYECLWTYRLYGVLHHSVEMESHIPDTSVLCLSSC